MKIEIVLKPFLWLLEHIKKCPIKVKSAVIERNEFTGHGVHQNMPQM